LIIFGQWPCNDLSEAAQKVFWFLRPDDEAALAAPLRSSKPDESESGRLHGSKKNSLFLLTF
jgi:hypothetical protein